MNRTDYPMYRDTNVEKLLKRYQETMTEQEAIEAAANDLKHRYDLLSDDAVFEIKSCIRIRNAIEKEKQEQENKLITCPACGARVSKEAEACPQCGHPLKEKKSNTGLYFILGVLAVVIGIFICAIC